MKSSPFAGGAISGARAVCACAATVQRSRAIPTASFLMNRTFRRILESRSRADFLSKNQSAQRSLLDGPFNLLPITSDVGRDLDRRKRRRELAFRVAIAADLVQRDGVVVAERLLSFGERTGAIERRRRIAERACAVQPFADFQQHRM